jgi:hypothetical protein
MSTDKNFVVYKNGKVFANIMASQSIVDGIGTRLIDEAGDVVFHDSSHSSIIVKGDAVAVGTTIE